MNFSFKRIVTGILLICCDIFKSVLFSFLFSNGIISDVVDDAIISFLFFVFASFGFFSFIGSGFILSFFVFTSFGFFSRAFLVFSGLFGELFGGLFLKLFEEDDDDFIISFFFLVFFCFTGCASAISIYNIYLLK